MWTRRRTPDATQKDADWCIYRHRQIVGRLHHAPGAQGGWPWQWSTFTYPCASGRSDTINAALHDLREVIRLRWPDDLPDVPRAGTRFDDLPSPARA